MDGWVTIGTKLDSKQLEKDLKNEYKKLEQFEKEAEKLTSQKIKLEAEIEIKGKEYERKIKEIQDRAKVNIEGISDRNYYARKAKEQKLQETAQLDINKVTEQYNAYLEQADSTLTSIDEKLQSNAHQQSLVNENIGQMSSKLSTMKGLENAKNTTEDIKRKTDGIGGSVEGVIKKITRWGLAIFGIRSAYLMVRQAMSTLSQYDDQMATDIQYIRYVLANMLKPIIETIINLVYKLLVYIAYIAKAWFGVNLFANATAKGFQSANKNAKDLKKTLTGFDEMNVLNDDGSVGTLGAPSVDLSNIGDVAIPWWVEWIAQNKQTVLSFLDDVLKAVVALKLAQIAINLSTIFTEGSKLLGVIKGLGTLAGIATIIYGIFETVQAIIAFIKDPSWANFNEILKGLEIIVIGVGIAMAALNASNPVGWILIAGGLIAELIGGLDGLCVALALASAAMIVFNATNPVGWIGLAVGVVGSIIGAFTNWGDETGETTRQLKDAKQATDDLREAQEELASQTSTYTSAVKNAEKKHNELIQAEEKNQMSGKELFDSVQIGTTKYEEMTDAQREVFDAYVANLEAQDRLNDATKKFTKAQNDANKASGELSATTYTATGNYDEYFKTLLEGYRNGEVESKTFFYGVEGMLKNMDEESRKTFLDGLPQDVKDGIKSAQVNFMTMPTLFTEQMKLIVRDSKVCFEEEVPWAIKDGLSTSKYSSTFSSFTYSWNSMISRLNKDIDVTARVTYYNTGMSGRGYAKGGMFYPSRLPRLGVGGIINRPGAGVPYNGAVIGERGAEAVLPLTDSQQMALLGEAIGKYITINANITNMMNGRVVGRNLQKVQNESAFAGNR